ncbi:MAG: aminotransferase class V-fold PLP-dependent enzyme [Chloroflexota bacterium]
MINALLDRSHYPSLVDWVYLNQASLGLVGEPAVQAMQNFLNDVGRHGNLYMSDAEEVAFFDNLRQRGAKMFHCPAEQIAILASASELLGQLPFMLRPAASSNIIAVATDFPAITRPWLRYAAEAGCEVRFVADVADVDLTDEVIGAMDGKTDVLALSYVQFSTGTQVDVPRLRQACNAVGAKLVVDVTQAAGVLEIETAVWQADAIVSSGYKWLGGHGGVALAALSPELSTQIPPLPGWMGTPDPFDFEATALPVAAGGRRFTQSTMSYVSLVGLTAALDELLALGEGQAEQHAFELAQRLIEGSGAYGWRPFRPLDDSAASPHIITLTHPEHEIGAVVAGLRQQGVICGGRNGRLRISLAPYNNSTDIDAFISALASL